MGPIAPTVCVTLLAHADLKLVSGEKRKRRLGRSRTLSGEWE